jgi:hypothetical protein
VVQFAPESLAQFAPDLVAQFDRNIHLIIHLALVAAMFGFGIGLNDK